jgi:hypothetical protein
MRKGMHITSGKVIRKRGGCIKSIDMIHAKVAKVKRKERKMFILYLHFAYSANSLRSLRGIILYIPLPQQSKATG